MKFGQDTMVVIWVDCCRSKIFPIALGTNLYNEKVIISICSEMADTG